MDIRYSEFIAYIRQRAGRSARTIGGRGAFTWKVVDGTLLIELPSGKKRNEALKWVEAFCDRFNECHSFKTTSYPTERNSSYMLGLARDFLAAKKG